MKILLLNTPSLKKRPVSRSMAGGIGFDSSEFMILPPLDLAIMATTLRTKGYKVDIIDADVLRYDDEMVLNLVKEGRYSSVVATLSLPTLVNDCSFISYLRDLVRDKVVIKTMIKDKSIIQGVIERSKADFVIHGECDLNIHELLEGRFTKGTAFYKDGCFVMEEEFVQNLDSLPFPSWDLLPYDKYTYPLLGQGVITMQTSRGCPFPCAYYCPYPLVEGKVWRHQSPERVFKEMEQIVNRYKINKILFRDAIFSMDKNRTHRICNLIIDNHLHVVWWCETRVDCLDDKLLEKMRRAGCIGMNIGVETGDEMVLQSQAKRGLTLEKLFRLREKAKAFGIKLHFLLLIGFPNETKRSIVDTFDMIQELEPESLGITIMTPYPGTLLFKEAEKKGWIESRDWKDYGGHQFVMHTDNMSKEDLIKGFKYIELGYELLKQKYTGKDKKEIQRLHQQIYTSLLTWALNLDDLQRKLGKDIDTNLTMSVVIPTYNRKEQLLNCLDRLAHQQIDPSRFEVIVVDDGSTDGTKESLSALKVPYSLKYFYQENAGPGAARNLGVSKAKNDIITFIGDDIMVTPDFVEEHLKTYQENSTPNVAVLGHIDWSPELEVTPFMDYITGAGGQQFSFQTIQDRQNAGFGHFYTSNISLKKAFLLEENYLFDTDFIYAACEDIDLGYRLSKRGLQIIYHPKALAYHFHPIDLEGFLEREYKVGEMVVIFVQKHPELLDHFGSQVKEIMESSHRSDPGQQKVLIEAIKELERVDLQKLRSIGINGQNLENKLLKDMLYPLYNAALNRARTSGILDRYNSPKALSPNCLSSFDIRRVSIIIPVFNKVEYTKECLKALSMTSYPDYEVIIVDNASTDGTKKFLQRLDGDASIITNSENLGFTKACNQGAKEASGDYLVFLNNDTVPLKGWLEALVEVAEENSKVGVVGSKLLFPDNTVQHAGVVFSKDLLPCHLYYSFKVNKDFEPINKRREFQAVTGACMLVRRNIFHDVGGFDDGYLNCYEDIDLCLRIKEKGYKIIYNPESILYHFEGITLSDQKKLTIEKNAKVFLEKWRGKIVSDEEWYYNEDGFIIVREGKSIRLEKTDKFTKVKGKDKVSVAYLLLEPVEFACPIIRVLSPIGKLAGIVNIDTSLDKYGNEFVVKEEILRSADIILIQRDGAIFSGIIPKLKAVGKKVIYEIDDLLTEIPEGNCNKPIVERFIPHIIDAIKRADAVVVSTDTLKDRLFPYNKNIHVLPNYIDLAIWGEKESRSFADKKRLVIGFQGTPTHQEDLAMITPAIEMVLREYGQRVIFRFFGCITDELRRMDGVEYVRDFIPNYRDYARYLKGLDIDIALAPLVKNSFNECKSNIKFLEYSICKIPGIYSHITPYSNTISHGETGLLADEDPESWYRTMVSLIEDEGLRRSISEKAYQDVIENYTIEANAYKWYDFYKAILSKEPEKSEEKITLLVHKRVSIIIPIFNKVEYTKQCLHVLASNTSYEPYEVIIVDNGSTDGTKEFLKNLSGDVKIITNETNLGFANACNQGAIGASGDYLVFLNNDTIPQPGWLEELVKIAQERQDVAIVGSKLLYPNGIVQHAGIVFGNFEGEGKMGYHLYKGLNKDHPAVNYVREFNAVTAACMLVKKDVFFNLGMFDEAYINGFEDVDFCLKVREKGYKVIYNPKSVLYHYEETTEGRSAHNKYNVQIFVDRWNSKIEPDDHIKAMEDGMEVNYLPNNIVQIFPIENFDKIRKWVKQAHQMKEQANYYQLTKTCEDILQLDPLNKDALKLMGEANQTLGNLEDAEKFFSKLISIEASLENLLSLGLVQKGLKKFQEAMQNLEKALQVSSFKFQVSSSELTQNSKLKTQNLMEVYVNLADCYTSLGRYDQGMEHYNLTRKFNGKDERPYVGLGVIEMQRGNMDKASEWFQKALGINARSHKALCGLGMVEWSNGEKDKGFAKFKETLNINAEDLTALHLLVQASYELGRLREAETYLKGYLDIHPGDIDMMFSLAGVLYSLRKFEESRENLEKIMIFNPEYQGAKELLEKINTPCYSH